MVLRYKIVNRKRWIPVFGLVICETWGKGARGYRNSGPVSQAASGPRLRGRPFGWVLHLGGNQRVHAEAPCWPSRRGLLQFDRIILSTCFPFGVLRRNIEYELQGQVLIYPHLWRMKRRVLSHLASIEPTGRKRLERPGGQEEFFGTRHYLPGDSLKMIDWKRTAKTATLVTREMTEVSPPKIMIALDLTQPPSADQELPAAPETSLVDTAISLAASLVCDAHLHGCLVGLAVIGVRCPTFPIHHSLPHRLKILQSLARLDVSQPTSECPDLPAAPTVVITLTDDLPRRFTKAVLLNAKQAKEYITGLQGAGSAVLNRRILTRRQSQFAKA